MTEKEQRAIISRLHRISGQVAGIEKMVSEGAPEEEIIIQINAVKQAAHRVGQMLLNSKVNDCIRFGSPVRRRGSGHRSLSEDTGVLFQNVTGWSGQEIRTGSAIGEGSFGFYFAIFHGNRRISIMARLKNQPKLRTNLDTDFLKLIAVLSMTVDHVGAVFFPEYPVFRWIGRMAFPLFCYCMTVGLPLHP